MKIYGAQKAQGLLSKLKYQKIQASISKLDVLFLNDKMLCKEPKEMLQCYVIKFCGKSYMHISIIEIDHST